MFKDQALIDHLDSSSTIHVDVGCFVELNQNNLQNIDTIGVFKYGDYSESDIRQWGKLPNSYWIIKDIASDIKDERDVNEFQYFGPKKKSDYFSLTDCFTDFRPRSGIVKLVQPPTADNTYMDDFKSVNRPRFYSPSVTDRFKYWTSWNTDIGPFIGLSNSDKSIQNAAPFVVYKSPVATNKICVKIQTGVGEAVSIKKSVGNFDPLSNLKYSNYPNKWKIQYLDINNVWHDAFIIPTYDAEVLDNSGVLDIVYTVKNPNVVDFPNFIVKGYVPTISHLPLSGRNGESYIVGRTETTIGDVYIWNGQWTNYGSLVFEWRLVKNNENPEDYAIKEYVDPTYYNPANDINDNFTGFVMVKGLRILVDSMVAANKSFDLIELSPRLFVNLSDMVIDYSIDKAISDTSSAIPVGDMSVSNGTVTLSNMNLALNKEMVFDVWTRKGSLLSGNIRKNTKFLFYEIIRNVPVDGVLYDKMIPVKSLYVSEKPVAISGTEDVSITLRDLTFRLEETYCPNLLMKDCSLTKAVATLLDWSGFTNYIFYFGEKKNNTSPLDTIIPYFFTNKTMTVAETLEMLSNASQCAMFFDEYNNFVVMPREHFGTDPVYTLRSTGSLQPNIEDMSVDVSVIGDAEVKFVHRDPARSTLPINSIGEDLKATRASGEKGNVTGYKISELWDASKINGGPTLSAAPLNKPLTSLLPKYDVASPDRIANMTFDIGLWAEYFPESGYIAVNGEIIRFDAKQYSIGGKSVWIESRSQLNELVGRSSFTMPDGSGQMIYPTGLMRIYTEVAKDENNVFKVVKHGRGQFGTLPAYHQAEPSDWLRSPTYVFRDVAFDTLYGKVEPSTFSLGRYTFSNGLFTNSVRKASDAPCTNYIYNSVHSRNRELTVSPITITPNNVNRLDADRRIMRSSALTFAGSPNGTPEDVYFKTKVLNGGHYNLFGARIGIIGTNNSDEGTSENQDPFGSMKFATYRLSSDDEKEENRSIIGAGGGLMIFSNRNWTTENKAKSNDGYYYEVLALNSSYTVSDGEVQEVVFANINFYKINRGLKSGSYYNVPVKLFSTYADILVTSGSQMARDRIVPGTGMIYDLAIEAKKVGKVGAFIRVFHLYLNDVLIGIVEEPGGNDIGYFPDWERGPEDKVEIGVFVRGSSQIQVEHLYATSTKSIKPQPIFGDINTANRPKSLKQFSPSSIFTASQVNGTSNGNAIYFEEFGTMAREVKHIKADFDMYPVLLSRVAPRPVYDRTYSVSGYYSDGYEADFMLWSQADRLISLSDDSSALSITGVAFENNDEQTIDIDDYLLGQYDGASRSASYQSGVNLRNRLLASRAAGQTEKIVFESQYIQNRQYALKMLKWITGFVGTERYEISMKAFAVPHLQIGDIVSINHDINSRVSGVLPQNDKSDDLTLPDVITSSIEFDGNGKRFMIQSISIDRDVDGPEYTIKLVELPNKNIWNAGDF